MSLDARKLCARDGQEWRAAFDCARKQARWVSVPLEGVGPDDLAQNACIRLMLELSEGRSPEGDVTPRLHRLVRLLSLDAARAEERRRVREEIAYHGCGAAAAAHAAELRRWRELLASPRTQDRVARMLASADGELLERWWAGERLVDLYHSTGVSIPALLRRIHGIARSLGACIAGEEAAAPTSGARPRPQPRLDVGSQLVRKPRARLRHRVTACQKASTEAPT